MQLLGPIPSRVRLTLKLGKYEPAVMLNKVRPGRCRAEVLLEAPEPAGNVGEAQQSGGALAVYKSCRFQAPVLLGLQEPAAVLRSAVPSDPLLKFRCQLLVQPTR